MTRLRTFLLPSRTHWFDDYNDEDYDLIVADEFMSSQPYNFMNQLLDGQVMKIPRRNRPDYIKRKNLPMIIVSNKYPDDMYPEIFKDNSLKESFISRFVVARPEQLIEITFE